MINVEQLNRTYQQSLNRQIQEFFTDQPIVNYQTALAGKNIPFSFFMFENKSDGIQKSFISERDKGFYIIRKEHWWMDGDEDGKCEIEACYTKDENNAYIGDKKMAYYLTKKIGITKFEKTHSSHCVCSIGFIEKEQKYAGWSHRALCKFGIGDKIFEPNFGDDNTLYIKHGKKTIKTLADAKLAAIRFAKYVS